MLHHDFFGQFHGTSNVFFLHVTQYFIQHLSGLWVQGIDVLFKDFVQRIGLDAFDLLRYRTHGQFYLANLK